MARIAYIAGNNILVDARVLKYIDSAVGAGHEVRGFGSDTTKPARVEHYNGVDLDIHGRDADVSPRIPKWDEAPHRVVLRWRYSYPWQLESASTQLHSWQRRARRASGAQKLVRTAHVRLAGAWVRVAGAWSKPWLRADNAGIDDPGLKMAEVMPFVADPNFDGESEFTVYDGAEEYLGPRIDAFEPDIIHAHDVHLLGVAVRAAQRARAQGRKVTLVYDAHEYVKGQTHLPARYRAGLIAMENALMGDVDKVITVSERLADYLVADFGLAERPQVVMNVTEPEEPPAGFVTVRETLDVGDAPIMAYSGNVNLMRGVDTAIEALPEMPGVHLAVLTQPTNRTMPRYLALARDLGVEDRVHQLPFVNARHVSPFLSDATIGVSPLQRTPNHDVAITNKFCEYIHARLPILTSDTPAQADLVTQYGIGAVHVAGDRESFAREASELIAHADEARAHLAAHPELNEIFTWARQAQQFLDLYDALTAA
ncbi:glycosyltransferase family 4 protein [Demequina sp. B12]|uniref:glycosyltransferase family 4 protein n=1 Tax=Demequina sp. B12 TaxID=2992757 RepID=UPI00237B7AE5|nr:glycosyltransferase family 4 protein [Demequina sp. B12]MDE0572234.1 glycosyltransferase family 4 protein [Demequina sp. B12]